MAFQSRQIVGSNQCRIHDQSAAGFHVHHLNGIGKIEPLLPGIQNLKDDDVIALEAELPNAFQNLPGRSIQVGDENHDTSPADGLGQCPQRFPESGRGLGPGLVDQVQQAQQVLPPAAGGQLVHQAGGEGGQPCSVPLALGEIGQAGREIAGVVHLGDRARAVGHGTGDVQQQIDVGAGLALVLLDVVAVGSGIHFPVDLANVVSLDILAVLGEIDTEAQEGRSMQAGDESFHDRSRHQLQVPDSGQNGGVQETQRRVLRGRSRLGNHGTGSLSGDRATSPRTAPVRLRSACQ